jgi:membrane protein YqaA with SNARE-associated domain
MTKSSYIPLLTGTSVILIGIALTGKNNLAGALIGYWIGFVYTQWLHRDTLRCVDGDVVTAIKRMRRSFFARLGMVTLVVAVVGRFQTDWLFTLALGIALGFVVSLVVGVKQFAERGE